MIHKGGSSLLTSDAVPSFCSDDPTAHRHNINSFHSLLAFRHAHRFAFGKSDLFFLLRSVSEECVTRTSSTTPALPHHLLPHQQRPHRTRLDVEEAEDSPSFSLPTPSPCPQEIAACEWIGLDELVSQPRFRASPLYNCVYDLCRHHATRCGGAASSGGENGNGTLLEGLGELVSLTPIWGTRLPMGFRPGSALLYHTSEAHHRGRHQAAEEGK